jgi:tetratricopeptide (TPR) repeat protein
MNAVRIAIVCLCVAWTSTAYAQSTDALLREAWSLRQAGNDTAAEPLLARAVANAGGPRAEAQWGLCLESLGRYPEAELHLRAALHAPDDPWIAHNLAALEGAYTLVLAHLPRAQRITVTTVRMLPATIVHRQVSPNARPAGIAALAAGGSLAAGGIASWIAREIMVDSFNARGCRIGAPYNPTGCDANAATSARDVATALTVTGLVTGAGLATVGAVLLVTSGREVRSILLACGPEFGGVSCTGRF